MKPTGLIIALILLVLLLGGGLIWQHFDHQAERLHVDEANAAMLARVDSLEDANAALSAEADTLAAMAAEHYRSGDSLAAVPTEKYVNHARALTHNAALDELGRRFWTDPIVAAPER